MDAQEESVIAWIKSNATPLKHIEAGNGFADLQPLKTMLSGARVVGLGEATHGTREFFQIKHRLLEFLVSEMGFTAFAMEASFAGCQPINDYILYGKGDLTTVLTGQGVVVWDTEEMAALIEWLRAHNQSVPDERKVRLYGVDAWCNDVGRRAILDYLLTADPVRVASTRSLFDALAAEEAKWPRRIDEPAKATLAQLVPRLEGLIDHLTASKEAYCRASSPVEFERALRYAVVMRQWVLVNGVQGQTRPPFMAENLMYVLDHGDPGTRCIAWAHNGHIRAGKDGSFGNRLRERYGQGYVGLGLQFNEGGFQTRTELSPGGILGELEVQTLPPAPAGSLPWSISQANIGNLVLNLRAPAGNPAVQQWLDTPQVLYSANWVCPAEFQFNWEASVAKEFDGIVFLERTTPARPTANALRSAAGGEGL